MKRPLPISAAILLALASLHASAAPDATSPAITEIPALTPSADLFGDWSTPTQIRSAAEAEKFFAGEALATLKEKIDFESQFLLVFAWRGSGQDQLDYTIAESFPEQISFSRIPGRTRDLRPHTRIFALRKNVTWSAAKTR